ncbi:MAG: hypothetical protein H7Z20_06780 [Bdellovibrio sp.]|nr:hypothetical protein [Methylotenera sp.]
MKFIRKLKVQSAPSQTKLFGGLIIAASLMFSQAAWAAGTASGTAINNIAKLGYSVSGVAQNEICSATGPAGNSLGNGGTSGTTCTAGSNGAINTAFVVDNKVNLTLVTNDVAAVPVVPGQTNVVTTYTLTNTGNTVQDYSFAAAQLATGSTVFTTNDNFDTGACNVFAETNGTPGYQAADTATFVDELLPDLTKVIYVVCASIPGTQVNNDQANVSLTATTLAGGAATAQGAALTNAATNTAGVDVVFADPAVATANANNTNPVQAGVDAKAIANDAYKVVSANLSVAKTVNLVCDPVNGNANPKNIPGAAVQYAITIVNTGAAAASLTTLSDVLQLAGSGPATSGGATGIVFDPKLNSGALPATNCVSGNGANTFSGTGFAAKTGAGIGPGVTAPGAAADAMTAGGAIAGQTVTITFSSLTTSAIAAGAATTLAAGSYITVYFNAFIQ